MTFAATKHEFNREQMGGYQRGVSRGGWVKQVMEIKSTPIVMSTE